MSAAEPRRGPAVVPRLDAAGCADAAIEHGVVAELSRHPWAGMVSPLVRDRCVLLCGCIADEERRADLVAAVASVRGVRSVRDRLIAINARPRVAFAAEGN